MDYTVKVLTCPLHIPHSCFTSKRHKPRSNPAFKPMLAQHKTNEEVRCKDQKWERHWHFLIRNNLFLFSILYIVSLNKAFYLANNLKYQNIIKYKHCSQCLHMRQRSKLKKSLTELCNWLPIWESYQQISASQGHQAPLKKCGTSHGYNLQSGNVSNESVR